MSAACYECYGVGAHAPDCIRGRYLMRKIECDLCHATGPNAETLQHASGCPELTNPQNFEPGPDRFFEYAPTRSLRNETRLSLREIDAPSVGYNSSPIEGVQTTLAERGSRYGDSRKQAKISAALKFVMRAVPGWERLSSHQQWALDFIADKLSRILNGDPDYADNWHDIAGYATLVERDLTERGA